MIEIILTIESVDQEKVGFSMRGHSSPEGATDLEVELAKELILLIDSKATGDPGDPLFTRTPLPIVPDDA